MRRLWTLAIVLSFGLTAASELRAQTAIEQTTRLAALARVWGLLKYFHPGITGGVIDWDTALTNAIPRVKAAESKAALNDELLRLIRDAGPEPRMPAGVQPNQPEADALFAWIDDVELLETPTREALKAVRHATVPRTSRYVKPAPGAGNPDFSGETAWQGGALPNEEQRLLALFRLWNMVQYYFPNRDIMDRPWGDVLVEAIPRFIGATDATTYHLIAAETIANIDDSHGATGSGTLSLHWGANLPAFRTRFIESQTVVTRVLQRYAGNADVRVGDVVTAINGVPTADLRAHIARYIASSNDGALQRVVDLYLFRTNDGSVRLTMSRGGSTRTVTVTTWPGGSITQEDTQITSQQPKWQVLAGNIGYVHMGLLTTADVPAMITALNNTRAIVFDVRNYPQGTLYLIAQWLNPEARNFVTFTTPDYERPGSFTWGPVLQAGPTTPRVNYYRGRVLVLGDERTQSHAEFTMMALRTAPDVVVLGSPTAGADGNISQIDLPGGIRTWFSGLGVFYADRSPTQRVGILPDVHVTPTIAGIQNGVDEVLQRALALVP